MQLLHCYLYNYCLIACDYLYKSVSTSNQILSSGMIVTAFTFPACHSGNGKGNGIDNGLWLQWVPRIDFYPIHGVTNTLLPWPVSRYLVLDGVPSLICMARPYFHAGSLLLKVQVPHVCCLYWKWYTLRNIGTGHARLVPSCHISALLKASDTRLYDHMVDS